MSPLAYAEGEDEDELANKRGMVIVEPSYVVSTEVDQEYKVVPYSERRGTWGALVSLGYSAYHPAYYQPDFVAPDQDFASVYGDAESPMIELAFAFKRNFAAGSLGGEFGISFYSNSADDESAGNSSLDLIVGRVGAIYSMDLIAKDPWFVPYVSGGLYVIKYSESLLGVSSNGITQMAPYARGGLAFNLDWIDPKAARTSFQDSGVQKTYAYVEAEKQMESGDEADPDFSNEVDWGAGFRVEF